MLNETSLQTLTIMTWVYSYMGNRAESRAKPATRFISVLFIFSRAYLC